MTADERRALRHRRRMDKLEYKAARYKSGRVSAASKIITCIAIAAYVITIACGIHLMYYFADTTAIYALFGSVTVPAGAAIFAFIKKNEAENTRGGITYEATMRENDFSCANNDENMAD